MPGGTSVKKGIVLSIIFWLIFGVALNTGTIMVYPVLIIISLICALIWGALLGVFWDKFGK